MKPGGSAAFDKALSTALRLLRGRDRFEAEVRGKCATAGCAPETVDAVIGYLIERKLLDDRRLARRVALRLAHEKMYGPMRIAAALQARGAPDEAVQEAMAALPDEMTLAEAVSKKLSAARSPGPATLARKLTSAGFSHTAITELLERFREE